MTGIYPPIELMEAWARERAHPLADPVISRIVQQCDGKQIVLFLNADLLSGGDEPTDADEMLHSLDELSRTIPVIVMSKRSVRSARHWFGLANVTYCGGDGMEILMADDSSVIASSAIDCLPALVRGETELRNRLRAIPGTSVDRDVFLLSVGMEDEEGSELSYVRTLVAGVKARYPKLSMRARQNAFELLPNGATTSRRDAVRLILDRLKPRAEGFAPIYIGRDREDDLAFELVRRRGGIVVEGGQNHERPSEIVMAKSQIGEFLKVLTGVVA